MKSANRTVSFVPPVGSVKLALTMVAPAASMTLMAFWKAVLTGPVLR